MYPLNPQGLKGFTSLSSAVISVGDSDSPVKACKPPKKQYKNNIFFLYQKTWDVYIMRISKLTSLKPVCFLSQTE